MAYIHVLERKSTIKKEFLRFEVKLIFCFILILLLMYLGFYWAIGIIAIIFCTSNLILKFYKKENNIFSKFMSKLEFNYEKGFPGKEASISLLGFMGMFIFAWILHYVINFPVVWALILALINVGLSNNLAALILFKKQSHYIIYGASLEFILLGSIISAIIFMFLGLPYYIALFLSFGPNLFLLIPYLDHNFPNMVTTILFYSLLFI